jgi:glucan phosphoethanolaminetransferase (alkaline phosphatase superfamily)
MPLRGKEIRITLAASYFLLAYGILFYYTYDDYFCSSSRTGQSHALVTIKLALACTAWDLCASACGALAAAITRRYSHWSGTAPLLSTLVSGLGFA